jgi:hypothetical protein
MQIALYRLHLFSRRQRSLCHGRTSSNCSLPLLDRAGVALPPSGPPPPRQDAPRDAAGLVPALSRFCTRRPDAPAPTSTATSAAETSTSGPVPAAAPASSLPVNAHSPGPYNVCSTRGSSPPQFRHLFQPTTAVGWMTRTGVRPWLRSTRPSSTTLPSASFHGRPVPMSLCLDRKVALQGQDTFGWHSRLSQGVLGCSGCSQQHDIDYDETFTSVVKLATIRTVLGIATSRCWPMH